ncbi:cytochrome c maturation protein CcmE [Inmirania thermothiophila]|uniref:Cytochrome c-type biogenesis protein CcmE n=1 Tax=Inmirania thermothiophila TaxID=1750597 RepID=A0A3N1XWB1_9GAMM|nr:cytochrome c maturation protein CcmE [Inmirania thermothiophila]ROR29482.1 cytochrome c-type biogenesis protein CcmE [Inmirania thermothiophila]
MRPRQRRLFLVGFIVFGVGVAVALALSAFRENLTFFYSPSQVLAGEAPADHLIRVGGVVADGSVRREADGLTVRFEVTDTVRSLPVHYRGILPDLFREGQGIVVQGRIGPDGVFRAETVLAKHDENYMPPEAEEAVRMAREGGATRVAE